MLTKYSKQCTEKFSKQVNLQGGQVPLVSPLVVTLLHCRFVFGELLPQSLSCFGDVHMISLPTGYFKTISFLSSSGVGCCTFTKASPILPL